MTRWDDYTSLREFPKYVERGGSIFSNGDLGYDLAAALGCCLNHRADFDWVLSDAAWGRLLRVQRELSRRCAAKRIGQEVGISSLHGQAGLSYVWRILRRVEFDADGNAILKDGVRGKEKN